MTPLDENVRRLKMYVLVRKDILTDIQVGVQAAHALVEYANTFGTQIIYKEWVEDHKTLIFLSASEDQINSFKNIFTKNGKRWKGFYEPDIGNILTAVAFQPLTHEEGMEVFGELNLA